VYSFYAIIGKKDDATWRRMPIDQKVQEGLTILFDSAAATLRSEETVVVPYAANYKTEPHELMAIDGFGLPNRLQAGLASLDTAPLLTSEDIEDGHLRAIVAIVDPSSPDLVIQVFNGRLAIKRKRWNLFIQGERLTKLESAGLTVDGKVHLLVLGNKLYLSSEWHARQVFELAEFFEEATQETMDNFFNSEHFRVTNPHDVVGFADSWMRKKIQSIMARNVLNNISAKGIQKAGKRYGIDVSLHRVSGKPPRVILPETKKELKTLLELLDDSYLESRMTKDAFKVTSKRKVSISE